jgi:hypothetical protein
MGGLLRFSKQGYKFATFLSPLTKAIGLYITLYSLTYAWPPIPQRNEAVHPFYARMASVNWVMVYPDYFRYQGR